MVNVLDHIEYNWIYNVYKSANTTFDMSANKTLAVAYISAIKAMANAFSIANVKRPSGTENSVTDNATSAKSLAFTTTASTYASSIYAIDTGLANLGVVSVTTGILVNTLDGGYGSAWTSTSALVGY